MLGHLGGKREDCDDGPAATAWREAWEESGKVTHPTTRTRQGVTQSHSR
jgi:hypothetical protein